MLRAIVRPADKTLQTAAWAALLGTVLVDATLVAFTRHFLLSVLVAAMVLAVFYARRLLDAPPVAAESSTADLSGEAAEPAVAVSETPTTGDEESPT